ncbi:MAG: hypothetical protein K2Y09_10810 [Nitrosomonas sp.]|uniref:Tc toxin subunit A-related protein n=1 Tax=Nitrosomonas sp. TaxID=42353 RepID=UPI001DE78F3B|nr:hypothetical protein [Nitrosomonas sp.]MBX9895652.1 hypothetical protein [Nitrosomonas sp.]
MANNYSQQIGYHISEAAVAVQIVATKFRRAPKFIYTFENFFHPFVGELIAKLNKESLSGMLDAKWQDSLKQDFFKTLYNPTENDFIQVNYFPKEIDVSACGSYANYNWELFFHIPLTIAVHLSKNQRFAEAQRWFHYIFNPTSNDHTVDKPQRFWNFLAFRKLDSAMTIDEIIRVLSTPETELSDSDQCRQNSILQGYYAILNKPFQPHAVARTRPIAYEYSVVMKYLDNVIAWADNLFQQDTVESINEATQLYVLAANILGERPQQIPSLGKVKPKTFAQLKKDGLGPIGNALVDLEGQFPLNLAIPSPATGSNSTENSGALFGIGRTLYFCVPKNDKLLGYWDTVADRLFKIRHCMNIAGVVRPLALFDPPIDPGMLVKAAAAGIDIGSIVSGLNQPIGPVRSLFLIQKALELCAEVRGLGNALLSALEKGDVEHLALLRQSHEIKIQKMAKDVRFLQWKQTQENTTSLLTSRKAALERLKYFRRLLNIPNDPNALDDLVIDHSEKAEGPAKLTEENFDETYGALVGQYDKTLMLQTLPNLTLAGDSSPGVLSGYSGSGKVYLTHNEDVELNTHLPAARDARLVASVANILSGVVNYIPDSEIHAHYWGIGVSAEMTGGQKLSIAAKAVAEVAQIVAAWEQDQAGMASRYASYERRADDWLLQYNLAAHELMQNGRQILTSLIAEQITHHEYLSNNKQIENAEEIQYFLDAVNSPDKAKFTNEQFYLWMQGEISRLYYEYYRFAFDTARKAERTMKQELMRPELDAQDFVKFNYWDAGRKGLLSGEALYRDVKRMEMAYHDSNKRELELTKSISLRQLNPVALLELKSIGTTQVTIPEWLFDLDGPGHYMRRIKSVALSIPAVTGPYTSVNCTLSLLQSSVRKSPVAGEDYARQGTEDDRFVDYIGAVQSIVTSGAQNDSGMFETNLRDERFLPFEGAGAISTWKLDLPKDYRTFDYDTISDVILTIRFTARQGVDLTKVKSALDAGFALLLNLRHDFPSEWAAFVNGAGDFTATIRKDYFPYFTLNQTITITGFDLYGQDVTKHHSVGNQSNWDTATNDLSSKDKQAFTVTIPPDGPGPGQVLIRAADANAFLIVKYILTSAK